ncbi:MAG: hypothetical protein PUF04_09375 [bacterium]|nr:hypothetical protein [bacterium]
MSKTTHLGLNTWGESENSGTWLAWRLAMAGTGNDSNMAIIDAWAKTIEEELSNIQPALEFDDAPTEGSANPVTSSGVYAALEERQPRIYEGGILCGDGEGGVYAAEVGVDYAAPDHDHEGTYCTRDELTAAVAELAPSFSPVVNVTYTSALLSHGIGNEHLGKTLKVVTTSGAVDGECVLYPRIDQSIPIGFECEVIWYGGTDKLCIKSSYSDGSPIDKMYNALEETGEVSLYVTAQYGVVVLKKIGDNEWIVGGDITL